MKFPFNAIKQSALHRRVRLLQDEYAKHRYSTPLFVLRETLGAFRLHNGFSISASLSFYALFALIPMALLIFFLLSHLVISSSYAVTQLSALTSNLVPKFSRRIMIEVYNASKHEAVWGAFGMFALFWIVTPLAGALRSAFYTIAAVVESPSFVQRKIKDAAAVLGILTMFFLFTFSGLMLGKIIKYLKPVALQPILISSLSSLLFITVLIAIFYRLFFPVKVAYRHILIGSLATALLWLAMRPAFGIFLSFNQSFGSIFGGMKNMFISIGWLYYTFAVFLLGTELIATLRKKDVLLLRGLFGELPEDKATYLGELMLRYGRHFQNGECVFRQNDAGHALYYLVAGQILLKQDGRVIRELVPGDYFGEMALLTSKPRIADAEVSSEWAEIVVISAENIETLLLSQPHVAMNFLKQMAIRLHNSHQHTLI